jgi:hypothetical protein
MPRQWTTMSGDIASRFTPKSLAHRLTDAGLDVEVRRWLYNHDGEYVRVLAADDFTLSRVDMTHYRADAICASFQRLQTTASLVSAALTKLQISHRFHLFNGRLLSMGYFHHGCSWGPANQSLQLDRSG